MTTRLIFLGGALPRPVPAKIPTDPYRRIAPIRAVGSKVRWTESVCVAAEPRHRVDQRTQFEIPRQLDPSSQQALMSDRVESVRVAKLRHGIAEVKLRLGEEEQMPQRRASQWLNLQVAAQNVAGKSRTLCARAPIRARRCSASSQIRLVVGRRVLEIRIPTQPIAREKESTLRSSGRLRIGYGPGLHLRSLRFVSLPVSIPGGQEGSREHTDLHRQEPLHSPAIVSESRPARTLMPGFQRR